ncbi:MAG: hypothetical protein WCI71_15325 [Bacteroidota bacterium]
MKKLCIVMLMSVFTLMAGNGFSQKLVSGSFGDLKGQTTINVQFDYANLIIGDAASPFATNKGITEKEYVTKKTNELNAKKTGDGDRWAQAWVDDRAKLFHPTFITELNDKLEKSGLVAKENAPDAKYTLIVKTVFIDAGFNVGISKKDAHINLLLDVVETAAPSKITASVDMKNIYKKSSWTVDGVSFDFAVGQRLQGCYEQAGISFGKFLAKGISK